MSHCKRYGEYQAIKVLKKIDVAASIALVVRTHGVTNQPIYRSRERYAGIAQSEIVEIKPLQVESCYLRHAVAQLSSDLAATKDAANGRTASLAARKLVIPPHLEAREGVFGDMSVARVMRPRPALHNLLTLINLELPAFLPLRSIA